VFGSLHRSNVANAYKALDFDKLGKGSLKIKETIRLTKDGSGGRVIDKADYKNSGTMTVPANTENLEPILLAMQCIEIMLGFYIEADSLRSTTRAVGDEQ